MIKNVFMIFGIIILTFSVLAYAGSEEREEVVKIKIASLSFVPVKWDKDSNLKKIEEMAREAAANGAKILVTPEGAVEGYVVNEVNKEENKDLNFENKFFELAEPLNGASVKRIAKLSRELKVDIILGILTLNKKMYWIVRDRGYEGEVFMILEVAPSGIKTILSLYGGGC